MLPNHTFCYLRELKINKIKGIFFQEGFNQRPLRIILAQLQFSLSVVKVLKQGAKMPLAIVCGLPSSGKTKFCIALRDYIERNHPEYPVCLINDESLNLSKQTSYNNPAEEKKSRAGFMSAVERSVSKNCIVIADGLNYIKGYRYQLYCVARAASTPHCAIHILNSTETCRRYNEGREDRYPSSVLEELLDRFEEPNNQTKWDSPLFSLMPDDDQAFAEICKTLCTIKTARPPSMATSTVQIYFLIP